MDRAPAGLERRDWNGGTKVNTLVATAAKSVARFGGERHAWCKEGVVQGRRGARNAWCKERLVQGAVGETTGGIAVVQRAMDLK